MASIELYTFENASGVEDSFTTHNPKEAEERAIKYGLRVIAQIYEWADSEVVWDFTPRLSKRTSNDPLPHALPRPARSPLGCTPKEEKRGEKIMTTTKHQAGEQVNFTCQLATEFDGQRYRKGDEIVIILGRDWDEEEGQGDGGPWGWGGYTSELLADLSAS